MNSTFSRLKRRDFLKLAAAGGLALSVPLVGTRLVPNIMDRIRKSPFSTSFNAIGTTVVITIDDDIATDYANQMVATVSNKITEIGNILTRFSGGNDFYSLNQTESLASPSQVSRNSPGTSSKLFSVHWWLFRHYRGTHLEHASELSGWTTIPN